MASVMLLSEEDVWACGVCGYTNMCFPDTCAQCLCPRNVDMNCLALFASANEHYSVAYKKMELTPRELEAIALGAKEKRRRRGRGVEMANLHLGLAPSVDMLASFGEEVDPKLLRRRERIRNYKATWTPPTKKFNALGHEIKREMLRKGDVVSLTRREEVLTCTINDDFTVQRAAGWVQVSHEPGVNENGKREKSRLFCTRVTDISATPSW